MTVVTSSRPYSVAGRRFDGFLADGSNGRTVPGILVVHEGGGFTQHPRDRAVMLAELGYVAYAPDFFGEAVSSLDHAYALAGPFSEDKTLLHRYGTAALDVLRAHPSVGEAPLGAIGFCWGGFAVLELACAEDLRCVVGFHPSLSFGPISAPEKIAASVLLCVGDRDPFVSLAEITEFIEQMHDSAVDCQALVLTGAPHGFTNPQHTLPESGTPNIGYDERADRRAWTAMRNLFDERLPVSG